MKILLNYSDETLDKPVLASIIREKNVLINILRAYADGRRGEMLVEVPDEVADDVVQSFKTRGVAVLIQDLIKLDRELCNDCGACVSVCATDALHFENDLSVAINQSECIQCALCIDSCPRFAITLKQGGGISFSSL